MEESSYKDWWKPQERNCKLPSAQAFAEANGLTVQEAEEILEPPQMGPLERYDDFWLNQIDWQAVTKKYGRGVPMFDLEPFRTKKPPWKNPNSLTKEKPPFICPFCMKQMEWRYWENDMPPDALCGLFGFIEHCKECKWWCRFEMTGLS